MESIDKLINGIDIEGLQQYVDTITKTPSEAISKYGIKAEWKGGVKTEITTLNQKVGDKEIEKQFQFTIDEPNELLGTNSYPTPQDYLLGGLAGCMMVGFVAGAANNNIELESVTLTINGDLNLRGFLSVDEQAPVGFEELKFNYDVKGNGTQADYDAIIENVRKTSPNYRTMTDNVKMTVVKN
ncbi:OsmC family protein [Aquimarina sp. 2201CG14-23]|uniref:OsmC family protein n=1 Tax=Aquimarina mycalae TaxID=3040073 RepID=UPI00247801F0|nr:OsmC family protein [Aquimarina sp. 2201CG14-23]MDH7445961.1 OsmC family protein [Aquimarina sp. 2201CG14-23]